MTEFLFEPPEDHNGFTMTHSGYSLPNHHQFFNDTDAIDPSDLSMHDNGFVQYTLGGGPSAAQQNTMSSSFNFGNSSIGTDELLDLEINPPSSAQKNSTSAAPINFNDLPMSHPSSSMAVYSPTPDTIQSPLVRNSYPNYDHFHPMNLQSAAHMHSPSNGGFNLNSKTRPSMQVIDIADSASNPRHSVASSKSLGVGLGTPDSSSFPTQPIRAPSMPRHRKKLSNQWDGTPGSGPSLTAESPLSSPGHLSHHASSISEVLKSGKHASLPSRVDGRSGGHETQEAKRRRRRASHNLVERRRRDNINERIQDLSHLVPQHRLEDDKVRKQLVSNSTATATGSLSPTPGPAGRPTAGNITLGIPMDDRDKGPNKGDILNGAVGWMRDLMWALHVKTQQEAELAELINSLGGTWPFEQTEEEKRMRSEVLDAIENNGPSSFNYSRGPGSGLRVPKHTNMAGDAVSGAEAMSPQSLPSPFNDTGSARSSSGQPQFWSGSGNADIFKEEDEYSMEMI